MVRYGMAKSFYKIPEKEIKLAVGELVAEDILVVSDSGFEKGIKLSGDIVWCRPERGCTVEYMPNTLDALRQPVFKGIRDDM